MYDEMWIALEWLTSLIYHPTVDFCDFWEYSEIRILQMVVDNIIFWEKYFT